MILDSGKKMYEYFLSEVRKEKTVVITPQQWMDIINTTAIDWMKVKMPDREFSQKRIDDLESVKVLTDGNQYPVIKSLTNQYNVFNIPYDLPGLPRYMFGLSVSFYYSTITTVADDVIDDDGGNSSTSRMFTPSEPDDELIAMANPVPNQDDKATSDVVSGVILRSDQRVVIKKNPYRRLSDSEDVYFEQRGNYIYCLPNKEKFNRMILEYYRYPIEIVFDGTNDSVGSFMPNQNKEISDIAVTRYLERVSDQRIQSQPMLNRAIPK